MKIVAKPIDVNATFIKNEKPIPKKFRIEEDDDIQTIKISKIFSVEEIKRAGTMALIYRCQSVVDGTEKQYELRYKLVEYQWDLYKI